jgi:hypothetical protein
MSFASSPKKTFKLLAHFFSMWKREESCGLLNCDLRDSWEKRLLRERSLDRSGILVLPVRIELTTSLLPRECFSGAIRRQAAV